MKCTGKEFKAFESDATYWHPGNAERESTYMDDVVLEINGEEVEDFEVQEFNDIDNIKIVSGHVINCTKGPMNQSLAGYFKRWKKAQTVETICVEIPKERRDEIVKTLGGMGLKVV